MPRKPRMYLAGVPSHVVQRGNNRNQCFFAIEDNLFYLDCLEDACARYRVDIHAYVLMTNHVHLLMTPADSDGISRVMQSVGRRYVQRINFRHRRSGTLWEGRHKACLVGSERYLLNCMRYIELNPVRAYLARRPEDYRWSSYVANTRAAGDRLVKPHDTYTRLGNSDPSRRSAYRELFTTRLEDAEINAIRRATQSSFPFGDERFVRQVENRIGRSAGHPSRGRPRCRGKSPGAV